MICFITDHKQKKRMAGVSLDAMIPREDFEVSGNSTQNTGTTATSIRLADLEKGSGIPCVT